MSLLETRNIVKRYGSRTVVDGVSLQINTGMVVGLLGPNGAGKTTCFYSIAGFIRPNQGNVLFDGEMILLMEARNYVDFMHSLFEMAKQS